MSNSLSVIPASIEGAAKPKPSKAEIIDALTNLRCQEIDAQVKAKVERRKQLEPIIEARIIELGKNIEPTVSSYGWVYSSKVSEPRLEIRIPKVPRDLEKLILEHDKLPRSFNPCDEKKVRKEVAEKVNGSLYRTERVDALLEDDDSRAALTAVLTKLYAKS